MKKTAKKITGVIAIVATMIACLCLLSVRAKAEGVDFSGTVTDRTTIGMIYLSTEGGTMEIKIDSSTDLSNAKFLLPGCTVTCTCYIGTDEYWHASKVVSSSAQGIVTVDTSSKATVRGTIAKGTSTEMLYLVIDNGTMQIKFDTSTDISGCSTFIVGKTVQVVCARGSDAYMHALSVSDSSGTTASGASASYSATSSVSGTVDKGTSSSRLYLNTSGGTMEIVLDSSSDLSASRTLIPGESVTVTFYRGDDAYNHASKVTKTSSKLSSTASLDGKNATYNGTIGADTNEGTLYLVTSGGTMKIRLDSQTTYTGTSVLIKDKKVSVVAQRGSDEYYHAISIENK